MRSFAAFSLLAVAGLSTAQQQYTIVPDSVDQATREYWCKQQKSQCPLICLQQPGVKTQNTISNECEWETLDYSCVCDNNVSPNITEYTQTMPYFTCTEWGNQCVAACASSDSACQSACRADHPCGAQDPVKPNATASASASKSAGPSPTQSNADDAQNTGLLGEGSSNSENTDTGAAVALGASFGTMVLALAGGAAFALL